jgi:hypothetical protein
MKTKITKEEFDYLYKELIKDRAKEEWKKLMGADPVCIRTVYPYKIEVTEIGEYYKITGSDAIEKNI